MLTTKRFFLYFPNAKRRELLSMYGQESNKKEKFYLESKPV